MPQQRFMPKMILFICATTLLAEGYAIASLNYHLWEEATFRAAMLDVKADVRE